MNRFIVASSALFLGASLWAADSATSAAPAGSNEPCKQIIQACQQAGFQKGMHKQGKGLYKDCLQPVIAGQSVEGVSVDPAVVSSCQERQAKRKARKQAATTTAAPATSDSK